MPASLYWESGLAVFPVSTCGDEGRLLGTRTLSPHGRQARGAQPQWATSGGLNFDDGAFFASVEGTYISDQYSTFMDEVLPGYATANANIGYRFTSIGFVKKPQMQLDMTNITDKKYLLGIQGVTSNAQATPARSGTTIAGSAPTYMIGGGFGISGTFSAAF